MTLLTEAAAPTNTLLGNPSALAKAVETRGRSLLNGAAAHGSRRAPQRRHAVDGRHPAVHGRRQPRRHPRRRSCTEARCSSSSSTRPQAPTSTPGRSSPSRRRSTSTTSPTSRPAAASIEHLVGAGVPYFAVSWRNPTAAQRDWNLDTYVAACKEAIEVACEITGSADANVVGMCAGAITMACLLGHLAATGERLVNSATFLVAGLDTAQESQIGMLASSAAVEAARVRSQRAGYLDGNDLAKVFAWLRPNDLVWNYWVNNYLLGQNPPAFDILYWNADTTRLPGRAARRLPRPVRLERARRGHAHGARHAGRSRQGRRRRLRRRRLDRPHRAVADRVPDHPAPRRRVGVRAQLERPHPGHRQPARATRSRRTSPARARRRPRRKHGSTAPRSTAARGGSTGRHGSAPVPASGAPRRRKLGSTAHPPARTLPRAATCSSQ